MKKPLWYEKLERWVDGDAPKLKDPEAHVSGKPDPVAAPDPSLGPSLLKASGTGAISRLSLFLSIVCCAVFALLM